MVKSVDYLKELRIKREAEGGGQKKRFIDDKVWDRYMKDQTMNEY